MHSTKLGCVEGRVGVLLHDHLNSMLVWTVPELIPRKQGGGGGGGGVMRAYSRIILRWSSFSDRTMMNDVYG